MMMVQLPMEGIKLKHARLSCLPVGVGPPRVGELAAVGQHCPSAVDLSELLLYHGERQTHLHGLKTSRKHKIGQTDRQTQTQTDRQRHDNINQSVKKQNTPYAYTCCICTHRHQQRHTRTHTDIDIDRHKAISIRIDKDTHTCT